MLAKLVGVSGVLTTLHLQNNAMCGIADGEGTYDATGIKAIAEALPFNKVLTSIDVGSNQIGKEEALKLVSAMKKTARGKQFLLDAGIVEEES